MQVVARAHQLVPPQRQAQLLQQLRADFSSLRDLQVSLARQVNCLAVFPALNQQLMPAQAAEQFRVPHRVSRQQLPCLQGLAEY